MTTFHSYIKQESGVPLGGIGTGSIELRPDGEFCEWQIANPEQFCKDCRDIHDADKGDGLNGSLSFYIRTETDEDVVVRRLGHGFGSFFNHEEYNYRMTSFNKTVESIDYTGIFPVTELKYNDRRLPVDISLTAVSPFVPYNERISGTPGFILKFCISNKSDRKVRVSLVSKLKNIFGSDIQTKNTVSGYKDAVILTMEGSDKENTLRSDNGSISLSMTGCGNPSYISGEYDAYMRECVAHGSLGVSEESFLLGILRDGVLPDTALREEPEVIQEVEALPDAEVDARLQEVLKTPFAKSILNRILHTNEHILENTEGKRSLLAYLADNISEMKKKGKWGTGALCIEKELLPDETVEQIFILTWHFPNLISSAGHYVGHMYENWFDNSVQVQKLLINQGKRIAESAEAFKENMYHADYSQVYSDAVSIHLANLVKSSWWAKNGDFGIWEGLGSCGLHTTDVTYHGSLGLLHLFPELQKKQMVMGAGFQREDGRVHHFFTPDFESVDDGFDRVDMNPQFVLLLYRDYVSTGDREYIRKLWPNLVLAMHNIEQLDGNNDGLPDIDTKRNTYDAWNFSGTSAYISVLWLAALKAAGYLAKEVSDRENEKRWESLLRKGKLAVDRLLWNGEYYNLWVNGEDRDECCMTDQLDGEYFARLTGLGNILPDDKVKKTLDFIYKHNYSAEQGLVNASYPEGKKISLFTYRNCQADANWSGIEYAMAAFYILAGEEEKAGRIVETVAERHQSIGQVWNHQECGDHYYRPLSSFALLKVLSGVDFNLAESKAVIRSDGIREGYFAPWITAAGYGTVEYKNGSVSIKCKEGRLVLSKIVILSSDANKVQKIVLNHQTLPQKNQKDGLTAFGEIGLKPEDELTIFI